MGAMDEYRSWQRLKESMANEELELPEDIRLGAIAAVERLARHLGPHWPRSDQATGHPILDLFWNRAPWTRVRLAELAGAMDLVEPHPGWRKLRSRLRRAESSGGALLELDMASRALQAGLAVVLEPQTVGRRHADLAVTGGTTQRPVTLYVEITGLAAHSQRAREALRLNDEIFPIFELIEADLDRGAGGRVLAEIPSHLRATVIEQARAFWDECKQTRRPLRRTIEGLFELWYEPERPDDKPGETRTIFSAPLEDNPYVRILRSIRSKVTQLPQLLPGLIMLRPPSSAVLWGGQSDQLRHLGDWIADQLAQWPQINGVALTYESMASADSARASAHQLSPLVVVLARERGRIWMQGALVVWNPERRHPEADTLVTAILS